MEWISNWIMQLSGIIVVWAVCEMIMLEGNMKKYVKLTIGIALMLTVIRPIFNVSPNIFSAEVPQIERRNAFKLTQSLREEEKRKIIDLYSKKLALSAEKIVEERWNLKSSATVEVEQNDERNFGAILALEVDVFGGISEVAEEIKSALCEKFGVESHRVTVKTRG